MTTYSIAKLSALEILDSRGRPTVKAWCELEGKGAGAASVPSGASTGAAEARELRDGERARYRGFGCRRAVAHVNGEINETLRGRTFADQAELDGALCDLDGSEGKGRLGANAILAVSIAFARAAAARREEPLYEYFAGLAGGGPGKLPRPTINLFSGGKHAGKQVEVQDVLVVPAGGRTMDECLAMTFEVYQAGVHWMYERYGMRALTADEGGLAPPFPSVEAMLEGACEAIRRAGWTPGREVALAVDVAASHFYSDGAYHIGDKPHSSAEMIERLRRWRDEFSLVSIEDGLYEEDWENWPHLREALTPEALVLGDDFLCSNPARIRRAIASGSADALLLKLNQIGTLTEAAEARRLAVEGGWHVTVSARSGETEDDWLADLAAGWRGNQIKIGSITQSERLAKYNRLLEIEAETGWPLDPWPARR